MTLEQKLKDSLKKTVTIHICVWNKDKTISLSKKENKQKEIKGILSINNQKQSHHNILKIDFAIKNSPKQKWKNENNIHLTQNEDLQNPNEPKTLKEEWYYNSIPLNPWIVYKFQGRNQGATRHKSIKNNS